MDNKNSSFRLPKGWVWTRFGEISLVGAGNPAPQGKDFFLNGIYPFVRVQDMGNLGSKVYLDKTKDYINSKAISKLKLFPKGSVLFTKSGMSILLNQRAVLTQNMYIVSHIGISIPLGNIPSEFLYYWLKTIDFKDLTHATTLPSLQLSKVKAIPTFLPPLPEQHRIVAKIEELFTKLDAGIEALKKIKAQLKRYRQAVLKYAFEGKLTEEWLNKHKDELEPASVLLERINVERKKLKASKAQRKQRSEIASLSARNDNLPELPEGWRWTHFRNIAQIVSGYAFKSKDFVNEGVPVIKIGNISYGEFIWKQQQFLPVEFIEKYTEFKIKPKSVLLTLTRPITNSKVKVCLYPRDAPIGLLNQRLAMIKPFMDRTRAYFLYFMRSDFFKMQITNKTSETLQPNLSPITLGDFAIPLPPELEIPEIISEIEHRFSVADEIEKTVEQSLKQSIRLRQSVLKKAFEGRLVPQDPDDESAEKLLERIKAEKAKFDKEKSSKKIWKRKTRQKGV